MSKRKPPKGERKPRDSMRGQRRSAPPKPAKAGGSEAIWLFGHHAVEAAIANPRRTIHKILVSDSAKPRIVAAVGRRNGACPAPQLADREQFDRLLPGGAVHQGAAMHAAPLPDIRLEDLLTATGDGAPARLAVIDQGTDPRNVGAILRSAAAFGIEAVIVTDRHAPETTGVMAKAASGALETVPLVRVANLARGLGQLKNAGFWTVGLDGAGDTPTDAFDWPDRAAIVLGAEDKGLRRLTREHCDFLVRIPIGAAMESLNLSNAAAIAFYAAATAKSKN